ncbi:MAG: EthD family reductase [Verrucomicrobia bacterium]|nr:EthD family reductase [Verrucomicrobiota bacterium]MDA1066400.1 EthD family reductase [Verrucomicrobiota bacterium]
MIRICVTYRRSEGSTFDVDYYQHVHFKLVHELLDPLGLVSAEMDVGIPGVGGTEAPFHAIGYLVFKNMDDCTAAFEKEGARLVADVINCTNIEPVIQISNYLSV